MNNMENVKELISDMNAGCSSITWSTEDGKHLWGRNFDFNHIANGSMITYVPKGKEYYGCGNILEKNIDESTKLISKYAAVGTGSLLMESTPVLYEGVNEKGLMGGQLYYRNYARYEDKAKEGTIGIQAPYVVTYLLTQCANIEEVIDALINKLTLVNVPMFGSIGTIHWSFTDKTGETVIIEPDKTGITIYRNSMGVLTNSPSYSWHQLNLYNYFNIRDLDYDNLTIDGFTLEQCASGNGTLGLPGDFTSQSRFVRLAFLKKYGVKGKTEEEGVTYGIHLLNNVAMPLGIVRVSQPGDLKHASGVVPFDYTVYTSMMCAESLKFYWVTYENQRVQCIDLNHLLDKDDYVQFDLGRVTEFKYLTK
ncbi:choloylglycine hydrolase family protein [Clostridium sp. Ade.TY]|uniref:linear amide C-N hydrolase n=1 Tax=Clostridium sp. Ade.TY TaxID=1391647 RepID=UPI00040A6CC4|nr:choloylglycine hydrolase family protein [Clostridium sp. Ade.TY]